MTIPALAHRTLTADPDTIKNGRTGMIVLWLTAAFAGLLFAASLTGNGTGLFRTGLFTGLIWAWALLPAVILAMFVGLLLHRHAAESAATGPRGPEE